MTGTIIGIRKTSRGTVVYISQKMTEIDNVSTGCCCYTSWLGDEPCPFSVGETVYLGKPFKGWVEISKLMKG